MLKRELMNGVSFMLGIVLVFILATYVFSAEGMKTLQFKDGTSLQIPEQAPSWMDEGWTHQIQSGQQFPSGEIAVVMNLNEDQTVCVFSIDVIPTKTGLWSTIAFAVMYKDKPGEVDLYEDEAYIKTGKASGVFVRLPKGTKRTGLEYTRWISGQEI